MEHIKEHLDGGRNAGFVYDGWKDVSKKHMEDLILTLDCFNFAIDSIKGDSEHNGIAVAWGIEQIFTKLESDYDVNSEGWWPPITINYYCSDDAGQQARARRILARRFPHILWVRCYAHQINLMVKALLNKPLFCETLEQASGAAKAVNASSSKWLKILYDRIKHYYGKGIAVTIFTIGETRWNSTYACFAFQLRIWHACRQFCADYSP